MTPEIKNTLIRILNIAINVNTILKINCDLEKEQKLNKQRTELDNAINWVKEQ